MIEVDVTFCVIRLNKFLGSRRSGHTHDSLKPRWLTFNVHPWSIIDANEGNSREWRTIVMRSKCGTFTKHRTHLLLLAVVEQLANIIAGQDARLHRWFEVGHSQ
jgi:hypothetical protein